MLHEHLNAAATNRRDDILEANADRLKILKSKGSRCRRLNAPSPSY